MTTIAHVRQLLGDALKGANDDARNNKVERLILATTGITAALEFLAEIEAKAPKLDDEYNPRRMLWTGEDFPTFLRYDSADRTSGLGTLDQAWAATSEFGYGTFMARETFEDSIIEMAREDIKRLTACDPAQSRTVQADEIDEDPPTARELDADLVLAGLSPTATAEDKELAILALKDAGLAG